MLRLGYLIAELVARAVPLGAARWIAERVGDIWYASSPRVRECLEHNLSLVPTVGGDQAARRKMARRIVRNFAKVVAEFLYLARIDSRSIGEMVDLDSLEAARDLIGDKPVLLVTAHLGNWEIGAAALAMAGVRLQVVVYDHPDPWIAALFRRTRQAKGLQVTSVKAAARSMSAALETSSVGVAGDRDFTGQGIPARFLGVQARVPSAYAGLAVAKGVRIVPGFCVRHGGGKYYLELDQPIVAAGRSAGDAAAIVARCIEVFEKYIEKYPEQWYLFEKIGE